MTDDAYLVEIRELKNSFENLKSVRKADLRRFYLQRHPDLTEQAFRRILYTLEKQKIVISIGSGVYVLRETSISTTKSKFTPALSSETESISSIIQKSFPYIRYLIWDTKILHEFMTHQPGRSQMVLEVEKDACESVFNRLREQFVGRVFLDPDRKSFERYILDNPDSIILYRLITQSPKMVLKGVPTARLEKILVDIFSDKERFFIFQGQELVTIYENAFATFWINEKTLFRYAGRRRIANELMTFINDHTTIELFQSQEPFE
jgi:hypothetical protein